MPEIRRSPESKTYTILFALFREYNKVMHQPIALNIFRQNADVIIIIHYTENLVIRVGSDINQRNIFIIDIQLFCF